MTSVTATADTCPTIAGIEADTGGDPGAVDPATRRAWLQHRIDRGAYRARAWSMGWGIGLGVLAVGQLAIVPAIPKDERPDYWVGAGAAGVGALTRAVFIPSVLIDRRRMRKKTFASDCAAVAEVERVVVRGAKWERKGQGWLMHALNLGFNVGVGLVLGLALDRPVPGNRLASIGAVVGELMIITQPNPMNATLRDYRVGQLTRRSTLRSAPWVFARGGGVTLSLRL